MKRLWFLIVLGVVVLCTVDWYFYGNFNTIEQKFVLFETVLFIC